MKRLFVFAAAAFGLLAVSSCGDDTSHLKPYTEERATVNPDPVLEYVVNLGDTLNPEWAFSVKLYEQQKSLQYRVLFKYKEVEGEKIFSYPNLGFMPLPGLRRQGEDSLACVVGFYDADSTFMDLRLIKVENGNLIYRHLKEYQVGEGKK
ncbi:MAG TPA: hypothetical protein PKE63_05640 [Lacibacter sp.]|nr:hypothetical protein [Lacibacter sp.]HMO87977.1 hypothetical protein [Lacibacter sp.]HMP86739.1 hypothetical protein [Lacibacter sp.]